MGLFSGKKKTYVSSVTYPLGEDGEERVDYLKHTVINATLQNRPMGESITHSYLRGQGIGLRNAFRYARDHYTNGVPTSAARFLDRPDTTLITPIVQPKFPGAQILYLTTVVGPADFEWWAEQLLTQEYGYDRVLKEFTRPPQGVDADAAVAYDLEPSGLVRILLMNGDGSTKVIDHRPSGYVSMATFLHCSYQARTVFTELDQTTTRPATVGEIDTVQVQTTIIDRVGERQERLVRIETDIVGGTATVHTRITVTVTTRPQYLLYRLGAGTHPSLDAWLSNAALVAPYYPSIPLRIDNKDVTTEAHQSQPLYQTGEKLLKRVGLDLGSVAKQVNENEGVKDIDYAFISFGVQLNTKSQEGKRYLYRFFEYLRGVTAGGGLLQATKADLGIWEAAFNAGTTSAAPKINAVEIYSAKNRAQNHDIKLQWDYIDTQLKSGQVFPGAKPGDVDISMSGVRIQRELFNMDMVLDNSKLYARRQVDVDSYEELEISGLVHENFIYQGKSVVVSAFDAFHDAEEEGFIVPLNQQIVRATPLVEVTQLSYEVCHIVFNCYKVVKQKWYQTGLFKWIMVIIAVVLMVFFPPAGVVAMAAVIGTGLVALIVAAAVTVLAGMILSNLVLKAAVALFGEKWGALIATIVMIVAMNWSSITNAVRTGISNIAITASTVMQASTAVLNMYGAYAQGQMSAIQKKLMGLETEYDKKMKEIEDLSKANLDTNTDLIDIFGMTQATNLHFESSQTFLGRTLLVGSEVAEITAGMIENFADVGLQLPTTG